MLLQIGSAFMLHLLLPAYFIYIILKETGQDKVSWLLKVVPGAGLFAYVTVGGRWDYFSRYLRFVPALLFAGAVLVSYRRVRARPFFAGREKWLSTGWAAAEALMALVIVAFTLAGFTYAPDPVRLSFPLQDGTYYVGQGGSSFWLNYHHTNEAQAYALDVVELNGLGMRADGIFPDERDEYEIYGDTVHSPCGGTVIAAENDRPGFEPPERDQEHPAGNHVMIACKGVSVLLAHLQQGSVTVAEGDSVTIGEPLGRVGNSGNTTEPHLHIHAVAGTPDGTLEGEGVPMLFDGEFPVRNTVIERPK